LVTGANAQDPIVPRRGNAVVTAPDRDNALAYQEFMAFIGRFGGLDRRKEMGRMPVQ